MPFKPRATCTRCRAGESGCIAPACRWGEARLGLPSFRFHGRVSLRRLALLEDVFNSYCTTGAVVRASGESLRWLNLHRALANPSSVSSRLSPLSNHLECSTVTFQTFTLISAV